MKNLSSLLNRAVLAVAGALALGACNRATYSFNNTAPAYLNSAPVATRPAAQPQATAEAAMPKALAAPAAEAVATPAAKPVAAVPAPQPATPAPAAATSAATPEIAAAPAPVKPTLAQRLVLKKLTKKLDKLASQAPQLKQRDAAAGTARLDGGLRQALVVGIIGLAIMLVAAIVNSGFIYLIGAIVLVVALVLLLLYLINQV